MAALLCFLPTGARASGIDAGVRVLHMPAGQANVWVRWEADVRGPQGEFLLLRGADPGSLRLVARVSARGAGEYGVMDLSGASGPRVYQLRYLDPRGHLHFLATQEIVVAASGVQQSDLWTFAPPPPDVTLFASQRLPDPLRPGALDRPAAAPGAAPAGPRPPTPPPRGA